MMLLRYLTIIGTIFISLYDDRFALQMPCIGEKFKPADIHVILKYCLLCILDVLHNAYKPLS